MNFGKKKGKKRYFTKVLTPFEIKVFLSTTNENFACNNPAASDSALKQWHTGIVRLTALQHNDVGGCSGAAIIFQGGSATLYHNPDNNVVPVYVLIGTPPAGGALGYRLARLRLETGLNTLQL